ncbi:MAG TPA: hypothetical protein DGH68_08245 [Bacteroidetes bacterium]|jgi:uncharacterized protein involved in outer membrane biogenesis|nr:hypothetical protein [Bacteroidota bacterium]
MALTRKAKTWLIVLSIPVVFVIGAAVALKMLFTSDRLKAFIIPKIEEATHRTVAVQSIGLSLLPTLAVEVDELTVSNKEGEGFTDKPMLQLDKLVLDVRLLPLLKGNIEVSHVTLERPYIFLEVNGKGEANYSDKQPINSSGEDTKNESPVAGLAQPPTTVSVETKAGGYGLLLSNLQIVNGTLEYFDRKGNSVTTMEGMEYKVRVEAPKGTNEISVDVQGSIEKFSYGSLSTPLVADLRLGLTQKFVYDMKTDVLKLQPGTANVQEIPLTVTGDVTGVTKVPVMNLVISSDKVSIPELLSLVPKEYMKKAEGVKGKGTAKVKIEVKGSVTDSSNPDITGMISATDASIQYAQLPKPITNVNIVTDFARSKVKQEFRVTKFSATLGNNPLAATMTVVNFDDPLLAMTLNATMNLAEVKDYYPLESGTELSGTLKTSVNIAGKVSNPSAMKAAGTMEFRGVTIKTATSKNPIQNLNGTIAFNNQLVEAKKISMNLGRSDLSLAFSMRNYLSMMSNDTKVPKASAGLTLNSNHLYTVDVMGEEKSPPATAGHPSSTAPAVEPKGETPDGGGGQKASQGKPVEAKKAGVPLPNVDMDIVATIGTLTMEKFELKNVRGTMKIANGIINLQSFTCNVFDGSVSTKGSLNMQKPERPTFDLAFDMNGVDAHTMLPKFTSFGERMFGRLSMNTTMKGMLNDTLGLVNQGLNGQGKVNIREGKLTGVKVNKVVASMLKLPDLEEITFKDWANTFTIVDGRVIIKDLKIAALGADYLVNGSQGLDGSLDYSMSMVLSDQTSAKVSIPGFAGEAVKLFKEPGGRVKLDFVVGGSYEDPKVSLDTKPAQKNAEELAKQKVAEETKKLGEDVKKKAGDLLKDLFKKKK